MMAYNIHATKWLEKRLCFPNNDTEVHINYARLCCLEQGLDFTHKIVSHLWDDLKTDYLNVLYVMDS